MEVRIMLWIHAQAGPVLDALAWLSHQLATTRFCVVLVCVLALWHVVRGQRRVALCWVALGLSVLTCQSALKRIVGRPRPQLWERTVDRPVDFSFPSGHAEASASFYPLLAFLLARRFPRRAVPIWSAAVGLALFVGLGRLYLGVHWPTDVLAGWALGAGLAALAIVGLKRYGGLSPST